MNLPRGALGWSREYDCGISWLRLLTLFVKILFSVQSHIKHDVLNLVRTCKTSPLFVPLAVQIDVDCSAVLFFNPTNPLESSDS